MKGRIIMADSGYVRSYTRRNPKRRRRRSNNSGKFLLTVLCLLIAVLVLVLVIKHNSGDRPEPPETSVTSGQVTTEKTKSPMMKAKPNRARKKLPAARAKRRVRLRPNQQQLP